MDLADKLRLESNSEHVAYTEFILRLKKKKDCIYCFYEGKDDNKYYGIRVQSSTKKQPEPINCGGKENVLEVRRLISQKKEYKTIDIFYFIDLDYEQSSYNIPDIYVLPSYSIENQYANKESLTKILKNEFSLNEEEDDFKIAVSSFEQLQQKFHENILLINAWLACQSDKRKELSIKTYLKIDNSIGSYFSSLVSTDLQSIKSLSDLNNTSKIEALFPDAPKITEEELNSKIEKLQTQSAEESFRGKFQLRFFISFLERLKSEICKKRSTIFNEKHKCSLRFEYATALTNLSIYANTPPCLHQYLER